MVTKSVMGGTLLALACWCSSLMPSKPMFSLVFCIGLILITMMKAKLFTSAIITDNTEECFEIFTGNFIGCVVTVMALSFAGYDMGNLAVIGDTKSSLTFAQAFIRGILCNLCVCMGSWMASKEFSGISKIAVIVPPIFLFVMCGFEHSIADIVFAVSPLILLCVILGNIVGGLIIRWYVKE